jgi:hypothetical protein
MPIIICNGLIHLCLANIYIVLYFNAMSHSDSLLCCNYYIEYHFLVFGEFIVLFW